MYIVIFTTNTKATCLSQPHTSLICPAPTNSNSFGFELSILFTLYPVNLHYAFRTPRADYQNRACPHCLVTGTTILGDELHIICHCPATKGGLDQFAAKFQGLTRLLDLPPFASFKPDKMTRMILGNPTHLPKC